MTGPATALYLKVSYQGITGDSGIHNSQHSPLSISSDHCHVLHVQQTSSSHGTPTHRLRKPGRATFFRFIDEKNEVSEQESHYASGAALRSWCRLWEAGREVGRPQKEGGQCSFPSGFPFLPSLGSTPHQQCTPFMPVAGPASRRPVHLHTPQGLSLALHGSCLRHLGSEHSSPSL